MVCIFLIVIVVVCRVYIGYGLRGIKETSMLWAEGVVFRIDMIIFLLFFILVLDDQTDTAF